MEAELVAFSSLVLSGGAIAATSKFYNCTAVRTAAGDYIFTIGQGGVDVGNMVASVIASSVATTGATTARACSLINTSDTAKNVQVRDDAGTLAEPTNLWVAFSRMPPL